MTSFVDATHPLNPVHCSVVLVCFSLWNMDIQKSQLVIILNYIKQLTFEAFRP